MGTGAHRRSAVTSAVRVPAAPALLCTLVYVVAVVCTPRHQVWAFVAHATILAVGALALRVPARALASRVVLEVPFVVFALMMPFVGRAPHVDVLGVSLSQPGLWAAWAIVVKGTLGVVASGLLVSTVSDVDLLAGLERLRVPPVLTGTMAFMLRYGDVVADEQRRMRIARLSRGDDPRWLWQAGTTARTLGALFVRSYERGERVQVAMASRGYGGTMPAQLLGTGRTDRAGRAVAALAAGAGAAAVVALTAVLT